MVISFCSVLRGRPKPRSVSFSLTPPQSKHWLNTTWLQADIQDLNIDAADDESEEEDEADDELDPIAAERKRRAKKRDLLRRSAGEPTKPEVSELLKLKDGFLDMLRKVLAD